jgi:hypothetical protein
MNAMPREAQPRDGDDLHLEVTTLRHDLEEPADLLPEDVRAERFREATLAEAELDQRAAEGRPPAEEEPRS